MIHKMKHAVSCLVCGSPLKRGLLSWHAFCSVCAYEAAALIPSINDAKVRTMLDESVRESGLRSLREQNFKSILSVLLPLTGNKKPKLLDIGSAHGWFLEMAAPFFEVQGIEPDQEMYRKTAARGLRVRNGYFPDLLSEDERFDVLIFNDVFEHIPDPGRVLDACARHLATRGLLVLNLPMSSGFFYKVSKLLLRFSIDGPFERMWQKGLPSPHLHYFNRKNLSDLARLHGFSVEKCISLPSVTLQGLYDRIFFMKGAGRVFNYLYFLAVVLAFPLVSLFPGDIAMCVYRKV